MPTPEEIIDIYTHIREGLTARLGEEGKKLRILYGELVKPPNAHVILTLPEVGDVLVGGASLKAMDFNSIVKAVSAMACPRGCQFYNRSCPEPFSFQGAT